MVLFTIIIIRAIATVDATTITGIIGNNHAYTNSNGGGGGSSGNSRNSTNANKHNPIENSNRLKAPVTFLDDYVDDDVNSRKISNNKNNNIDDDGNIQCPSDTDNSACSCYKSEKGKLIFLFHIHISHTTTTNTAVLNAKNQNAYKLNRLNCKYKILLCLYAVSM